MGMLQRSGKVIAFPISDVNMITIHKAVHKHIKAGSKIMGDGFMGYRSLKYHFNMIKRQIRKLFISYKIQDKNIEFVNLFVSILCI